MNLVLGGGIAGLSALRRLLDKGQDAILFEKRRSLGGLCDGFEKQGYWFDTAIHLSFAADDIRPFFDATPHIKHIPDPYNFDDGRWIKHPAQNNLYPLTPQEKSDIIRGFIENPHRNDTPDTYEKWLRVQYGDVFSEKYPLRYTKKYWRCSASELSVDWVGSRMYQPNLEEILLGAFSEATPVTYYAKEMRYPEAGKYRTFLSPLISHNHIRVDSEVIRIDTNRRNVELATGERLGYERIFTSIPLPEIPRLIPDLPQEIAACCQALEWTSVRLVSLGFNRPDIPKHLWDYYYDESFPASRSHSPSIKSPRNAPEDASSIQFEIYANKRREEFPDPEASLSSVIEYAEKYSWFHKEDVVVSDVRDIEYANVLFLHGMEQARDAIRAWLKTRGIHAIGRFGEWGYLWSDQSFSSGRTAVDKVIHAS